MRFHDARQVRFHSIKEREKDGMSKLCWVLFHCRFPGNSEVKLVGMLAAQGGLPEVTL